MSIKKFAGAAVLGHPMSVVGNGLARSAVRTAFCRPMSASLLMAGMMLVLSFAATGAAQTWDCGYGEADNVLTCTLAGGVFTVSGEGYMSNHSSYNGISQAPWKDHLNSITAVVIGNGVTDLGNNAFAGAVNLISVTIGSGVTNNFTDAWGADPFYNCPALTTIEVSNANPRYSDIGGIVFSKAQDTLVYYPRGKTGAYEIPNGVTTIEPFAFGNSLGLTSVTMPASVTNIGGSAFSGTGLTSVIIGDGVTTVGQSAFSNCSGLESITIGNSLTDVNAYNLPLSATNLVSIAVAGANPRYSADDGVLFSKAQDTLVRYPIGKSGTSYTIPNTVKIIAASAFASCAGLSEVTIGSGVTTILSNAFYNCTGLTSIINLNPVPPPTVAAFDVTTRLFVPLTVPTASVEAYKAHSVWGGFLRINGETNLASTTWNCGLPASGTTPTSAVTCVLDETGTFTVSGTGAMMNYDSTSSLIGGVEYGSFYPHSTAPWRGVGSGIKAVVIEDGVTSVGNRAFAAYSSQTGMYNNLTSVTIGADVTSIGISAFYAYDVSVSPVELTLGNKVSTVGNNAFGGNRISSLTLGSAITSTALANIPISNSALTSITVDPANAAYSDIGGVLFNKAKTQLIRYPAGKQGAYIIPDGVTIANAAFQNSAGLTSVTIPVGVTTIPASAFSGCGKLTAVDIPAGVTTIGNTAFLGCTSMVSIRIPVGVSSIGENAFINCPNVTDLTIGGSGSNMSISAGTFGTCRYSTSNYNTINGCTGIETITLLGGIISTTNIPIGNAALTSITVDAANTAFSSDGGVLFNKNKTELVRYPQSKAGAAYTIPSTVTSIAARAFYGCTNLKELTIPQSLTTIGDNAFWNAALTSVTLLPTTPPTSNGSIRDTACLTVPEGSVDDYYRHPSWTNYTCVNGGTLNPRWVSGTTFVELIDGTLTITGTGAGGAGAMSGNSGWSNYSNSITAVDIKPGVTTIGSDAFYNLVNVKSIDIPTSVTTINYRAFAGLTNVKTLNIPASVTTIGTNAFQNSGLTSITIPSGITTISNYAFSNCASLASVTIPSSVTTIGQNAFANCTKLTSVKLPDGLTSIGANAFSGSGLASIFIPSGVTTIGNAAFYNCANLETVISVRATPPTASGTGTNHPFGNVPATACLYVPTANVAAYTTAAGWNRFTCIENLSAIPDGIVLTWTSGAATVTYNAKTMMVRGTGAMADYATAAAVPWGAFGGAVTNVIIESGVTSVGQNAFNGFAYLTSVSLPNSVTSIGANAFEGNIRLVTVNTGSGVKTIGASAFSGNAGMVSVIIGNGVTSIGASAFSGCVSLTSVTSLNEPPTITANTFNNVNTTTCKLIVPQSEIGPYAAAPYWSDFTTREAVQFTVVPVTEISGVPSSMLSGGTLPLTATVTPTNATNKTIAWSVANAGLTGAMIGEGNVLSAGSAGTVVVRAAIADGAIVGVYFERYFFITVSPTAKELDDEAISDAKKEVEDALTNIPPISQSTASTLAEIKAILQQILNALLSIGAQSAPPSDFALLPMSSLSSSGVTATIVDGEYVAAIAGTVDNQSGTNGSYTFTVKLNKGEGTEQVAGPFMVVITAAPYTPSSVLTSDRSIPVNNNDNSAAVVIPTNTVGFELTVGPNPVRKIDGKSVNIFIIGKRVDKGELRVYDATGNVISKINIRDDVIRDDAVGATVGNDNIRRIIGSWDLRDTKNRPVSEGAYLIRGVVKTIDGKREKVSAVIGVR